MWIAVSETHGIDYIHSQNAEGLNVLKNTIAKCRTENFPIKRRFPMD